MTTPANIYPAIGKLEFQHSISLYSYSRR